MSFTEEVAPETETLRALLSCALQQPAVVGSRIVALWWLHRLQRARHRWNESANADGPHNLASGSDALHNARVETRRLRNALRLYRDHVADSVRKRDLKHLRALNKIMSKARDADVACTWLTTQADVLPDNVRLEAVRLREALSTDSRGRARNVSRAFRRHFDGTAAALKDQLSHYRLTGSIGSDREPERFSQTLSIALDEAVQDIRHTLENVHAVTDTATLHQVRRGLKQIRDIVRPFVSDEPAFTALYDVATRGQDTLGAMRDAQQLADRARTEEFWALALELDNVSLSHYNAFITEWKRDGELSVADGLNAAHVALQRSPDDSPYPAAGNGVPLEIERKYLLTACPPEAAGTAGIRIEQGWLPGKTLRERLRRSTYQTGVVRYTRTVKFGGGMARVELEEDTERALFDTLWPYTAARRVNKRRHAIRDGNYTWEIDVFTDRDLVLAEVELQSESDQPEPPEWLSRFIVREVTNEKEFFNANLARPETHSPPPVAELQSL